MAMAMAMAVALKDTLISYALEGTIKKLISETRLLIGLEEKIDELQSTLKSLHQYLQDAFAKEIQNMAIRNWLEGLRDLASTTEDIFDEIHYEERRHKVEVRSMLDKVTNFVSPSNPIRFQAKIAHRIEKINKALLKHKHEAAALGLIQISYSIPTRIETDAFLDTSEEVIGREDGVSNILRMITAGNSSTGTLVIPIVGMGGLGKTTLAKLLTDEVQKRRMFDETCWVCVSNIFEDKVILGGMLESLSITAGKKDTIHAILQFLRIKLENKSFFLVLDDVWNDDRNKWDNFMRQLSKINTPMKNCVIVTTRSYKVASITESDHMRRYEPGLLSPDACWSIIKNKVFGIGVQDVPRGLEDIGKEIAGKCRGLPLLARVLGGTMRSKKLEDDWREINQSTELSSIEGNDEVWQILKLSFDRLSSASLKQSFAYCAFLPQDSVIEKKLLTQMWVAEGYVQSDEERNMTAEEVGEENFRILYANSLFQDAKRNKLGDVISCKMHDAVHELAVSVSKSRSYKGKRILDIHDHDTTDLPKSSIRPKHLRYLDISETSIRILPKSVRKSYNLQTLRLVKCGSLEIPLQGILNLISLKHLILDPPNIVPSNIGKLTCLETLPKFAVGREKGRQIKELGSLRQLGGILEISCLENVTSKLEADEANMKEKAKLQTLKYRWSEKCGRDEDEKVLDGLQPHSNLRELYIRHFMGQLSSWLSDPLALKSLCRLKLDGCRNCLKLPTLGELPRLQFLKVVGMENVQRISIEFYTRRVDRTRSSIFFPSLKQLEMRNMRQLEEWILPASEQGMIVFPCLEELTIYKCKMLTRIPVSQFKSLKSLTLYNCKKLKDLGDECLEEALPQSGLTYLVSLDIDHCKIKCLPRGLQFSKSLTYFVIVSLSELAVVPDYLGDLTSLVVFKIICCDALTRTPTRLQSIESLKTLMIAHCDNLKNIPENLEKLSSLECLRIACCPKLSCVPKKFPCYERLSELHIGGFSTEIEEFPNICSTSVGHLIIVGWKGLKSVPDQFRNFTSVYSLRIHNFVDIEVLPDWLGNLSSLCSLSLYMCPNLKSLPKTITHLTNLHFVDVCLSPLATQLLSGNDESSNIAHVATVQIEGGSSKTAEFSAWRRRCTTQKAELVH